MGTWELNRVGATAAIVAEPGAGTVTLKVTWGMVQDLDTAKEFRALLDAAIRTAEGGDPL